jgi:DNA-binding transcriptional ArsR family regulator
MSEPRTAFLPIYRSEHQAAIIGAIFSQPDRVWTGPELVETTGASQPTISREVSSLADAGLITKGSIGRTSTITANPDTPVFHELVQLALKTYGPIGVLTRHLKDLEGLREAHIVGSWAHRYHGQHGHFPNDIDVALIGDVALIDALDACDAAAEEIGMTVQPTVVGPQEWSQRSSAFAADVQSGPTVRLLTDEPVPA